MKILFVTPYITSHEHPGFLKNQTGLGYMVKDIADSVGKNEDVDLFAVNVMAPSLKIGNFNTLGRNWLSFLKGCSLKMLIGAFRFNNRYKLPLIEKIRVYYQFLSVGQLQKLIRKYDIVHIHGCAPFTSAMVHLCKKHNIPFLVTLHGLVSFEEEVILHPSLKKLEKDFLYEAYINDYNISFISTGNLDTVNHYLQNERF